jgi:hypothetical protein
MSVSRVHPATLLPPLAGGVTAFAVEGGGAARRAPSASRNARHLPRKYGGGKQRMEAGR